MRFSISRRLACPVLFASLLGSGAVLAAQTPAAPPAPVPPGSVPSLPPATSGNPSVLPSMPAASPAGQAPATPAAPNANPSVYRDPLTQPIFVAPPTATAPSPQTPAPGSMPASTSPSVLQPASPVQVAMPAPATVASVSAVSSLPAFDPAEEGRLHTDALGSTYIPLDSPIYPMALRLYSLGYLDRLFISMRPWTRRSLLHAMDESSFDITTDGGDEATAILARLQTLLQAEEPPPGQAMGQTMGRDRGRIGGLESVYTRLMGIGGTTLRDSYHIGQTLINDYGRPYEPGFNNVTGFTSVNEWGRFSLYVRGEYQHAPSATGYNPALSTYLSALDFINFNDPSGYQRHQDTIPSGPIAAVNPFRLQEATFSYHLLGHEASIGKSDAWFGPGVGGSMAWSNNAEDIYSFRINRVEPMHIPYLQRIIGPIRYDFMVGALQGHSAPNGPWVNQVMVAIQPYKDFTFSIQKTAIWGGHGHGCASPTGIYPCNEPITLHTFLKSLFDIGDVTGDEKYSRNDPGARFSSATFSWRLPFLRRDVTLYTDSTTHDDDLPVSAPRRAGWRPGIYFSHVPFAPKFDFRAEATYTDYVTKRSMSGQGAYFEGVQSQGYTNKGFIFGDWVGREGKGGQAWLTYHLGPEDFIQLEYLHKKTAKDFIVNGVTQTQVKLEMLKHFGHNLEADAWLQYESWKAPVYLPGSQSNFIGTVQLTWYPKLHSANGVHSPNAR